VDRDAETAASQLLASVVGLSVLVKAGGSSERFGAVVDGIVDGL
jgi:TetR/AcrR family transcriptional repressor of nem operon